MDPNSTLVRIRWFTSGDGWTHVSRAYAELRQQFAALDEWLSAGGLAPTAWRSASEAAGSEWDEDPGAILARIRRIVQEVGPDHGDAESYFYTLVEEIAGLDNWLSGGGDLPEAWAR